MGESGELKVSQASYDYTRPYWDQIGGTLVGRHVFDMTDGWDGKPPGVIDHVVVVTHRPKPEGWDPEAHLLGDPDDLILGHRVLHLRYRVRR